ncbi:GDYXXLXY domain-containing protein [Thiolinea disciformis]|uniref:GDYXXLXY domain-containing protein n=1 Tax=Thiolinea disciformis TaxID=125614 RepID=UPI000362CFFF|nr:GDYXXLXY domain-containing protein [Thiolinea disciformis]
MKTPRMRLVAALVFPIVVLAGNAWMNHQQREAGKRITFPIEGFDPRDLLSGHYLVFKVNYEIAQGNSCPSSDINAKLCLEPEKRVYPEDELPAQCTLYLPGTCNSDKQFDAGFERFYIPEQKAAQLEQLVQAKRAKLELSIDQYGNASIRDLLIDNKPWKQVLSD